ncbi:MAG: RNase adapter RapZ [Oligoflexus sp.]
MNAVIQNQPCLVVVTGLSGAGKTIAINALEDMNYYCIDNLPLELIDPAIDYFLQANHLTPRFALGVDVRNPRFLTEFQQLQGRIAGKIKTQILFLTCNDEQLVQRYSTTRRRHPLLDEGGELLAAIRREKVALAPLEEWSDTVFDTSTWTPHFLARQIEQHFSNGRSGRSLYVTVTSFGFKHGPFKTADSIFDVRFLKNPHFEPQLKERTGLEAPVRDYVFTDANAQLFLDQLVQLHRFLLPEYYLEGKHYFRIGLGCTGGKHRSVALAEALAMELAKANLSNIYVSVSHRDLEIHPRELSQLP